MWCYSTVRFVQVRWIATGRRTRRSSSLRVGAERRGTRAPCSCGPRPCCPDHQRDQQHHGHDQPVFHAGGSQRGVSIIHPEGGADMRLLSLQRSPTCFDAIANVRDARVPGAASRFGVSVREYRKPCPAVEASC